MRSPASRSKEIATTLRATPGLKTAGFIWRSESYGFCGRFRTFKRSLIVIVTLRFGPRDAVKFTLLPRRQETIQNIQIWNEHAIKPLPIRSAQIRRITHPGLAVTVRDSPAGSGTCRGDTTASIWVVVRGHGGEARRTSLLATVAHCQCCQVLVANDV